MKKYKIVESEPQIVADLDGAALYETSIKSSFATNLHSKSKMGVKKSFADAVAQKLGMNVYEFAPLLHISSRTLSRYSSDTLMDTITTEHILLLDSLLEDGSEAFGSTESFRSWLHSDVRTLDYKKPITFLDTIFGIQMVKDIVGRIRYGVY